MINTIIFDLDGTLVDTNDLVSKSFTHIFKMFFPEHKLSKEELISFYGPTLEASFSKYTKDKKILKQMLLEYQKFNIEFHDEYIKLFDNVLKTIKHLYSQRYNLAIVSSKRKKVINMGLKAAGLAPYFNVIVGFEDVSKHKPDPESIYMALDNFSDVTKAIYIGDNPSDIIAGRNAGIYTCGVNWSLKTMELRRLNPDYYLYNIEEIIEVVKCSK